MPGDQVAVLGTVDYNKVTYNDLLSAPLGTSPVNGSNNNQNRLVPGTVLAARTRTGNLAKIRINSYGYDLGISVTTYRQAAQATNPPPPVLCGNAGVLQGTFIFDAEGCRQSGDLTGDLWWEQIDSVRRQLVPNPGATIAVLGKLDFGAVSRNDLLTVPYNAAPIDGSANSQNKLSPGTVLAVRTRNGHYAKLRIDTYGYDLGVTVVTYQ
jgi:hypothetical protein